MEERKENGDENSKKRGGLFGVEWGGHREWRGGQIDPRKEVGLVEAAPAKSYYYFLGWFR